MVDKIKRDARARMARTGETYAQARRAVAEHPDPADVRAAAAVLLRAWAPGALTQDSDEDDGDGCACGGETGDGRPICNCADGCGCRSCGHYRHASTGRCHLRTPRDGQPYARCGADTRYRIRPYCIHRSGVTREASDSDQGATNGMVKLGDSIQWHPTTYACSTQHARALIEADRQRRAAYPADSPLAAASTMYEVEGWRYEPDDVDVPGPLPVLRGQLESAAYWAKQAVVDAYHDSAGHGLTWTLRQVALSVHYAAKAGVDVES